MIRIQLEDVRFAPAGRALFRGLRWSIGERERIGFVGANGVGKSSLLRLIAGEIVPDEGRIHRHRTTRIGYLPQQLPARPGETLLDVAMRRPEGLVRVEEELARIEARLGKPEIYGDERRLAAQLARQDEELERYEKLGGPTHEGRLRELLARFDLDATIQATAADDLSGGQKKIAALIALAIEGPNVLLLDEPDNHLDLEAKRHLERFIRGYDGTVVIVSHDRHLLDATVDRIADLEDGKLGLYPGTYSMYAEARALRRMKQQRDHAVQQKEIARIEASIARFEEWASRVVNERHAKQARTRRRWLERMERIDPVRAQQRISLALPGGRGSRRALVMEGLTMGFGERVLFDGLDLEVRHGERVGLVGPNGCGKSVLLSLVVGSLEPRAGTLRIGPGTRVGYYAQEHETLDGWLDRTPIDLVRGVTPMTEEAAVGLLMRFLFSYEQLRQPIGVFSGGERSRLQLARLMLTRPNLLVLDEPTNNLDIPSAEVLEETIGEYDGAVFVASHDRYFLDRVVDRIAELGPCGVTEYRGGYTDYLEERLGRQI